MNLGKMVDGIASCGVYAGECNTMPNDLYHASLSIMQVYSNFGSSWPHGCDIRVVSYRVFLHCLFTRGSKQCGFIMPIVSPLTCL